jgi:hypothetical protein
MTTVLISPGLASSDRPLHLLDNALRLLDSGPDGSSELYAELALVRGRKELGADERQQHEARGDHGQDRPDQGRAVVEAPLEAALIEGVEPVEDPSAPREDRVEPLPEAPMLRRLVLASEPPQAKEGGDRPRHEEGGEERKRDGEGQRDEEEPRLALEEDRGQEDDNGRDRGHEDGHRHLARSTRPRRASQMSVALCSSSDGVVHGAAVASARPPSVNVERLAEKYIAIMVSRSDSGWRSR